MNMIHTYSDDYHADTMLHILWKLYYWTKLFPSPFEAYFMYVYYVTKPFDATMMPIRVENLYFGLPHWQSLNSCYNWNDSVRLLFMFVCGETSQNQCSG